jgi:hypothetical protein
VDHTHARVQASAFFFDGISTTVPWGRKGRGVSARMQTVGAVGVWRGGDEGDGTWEGALVGETLIVGKETGEEDEDEAVEERSEENDQSDEARMSVVVLHRARGRCYLVSFSLTPNVKIPMNWGLRRLRGVTFDFIDPAEA